MMGSRGMLTKLPTTDVSMRVAAAAVARGLLLLRAVSEEQRPSSSSMSMMMMSLRANLFFLMKNEEAFPNIDSAFHAEGKLRGPKLIFH